MKNKKEFFGVLISVLVCTFLAVLGIYAATTIGNSVQVNGSSASTELSVIGTASISQDFWASGSFQFGAGEGTGSLSYSRLGAGTTDHSLADADDLLITGLLEVDDTAHFDGVVSVSSGGLILDGGATITTVVASPSCTSCVLGSIFIDTANGTIHMCDATNTCTLIGPN